MTVRGSVGRRYRDRIECGRLGRSRGGVRQPDVLELRDIDKPVVEGNEEALVRVHADSRGVAAGFYLRPGVSGSVPV